MYAVYLGLRRPLPLALLRRFRFRFQRYDGVVQPPQRHVDYFGDADAEPFRDGFEEIPFADAGDTVSIGADTEMGVDNAPEFQVPVPSPRRWSS